MTDVDASRRVLEGFMKSDEWRWREEATLIALSLAETPLWNIKALWQIWRVLRHARHHWLERKPAGFRFSCEHLHD